MVDAAAFACAGIRPEARAEELTIEDWGRLAACNDVRALAKLTLSLRVTGVRADGYHLLDAEMVTLDLADELTFSDGDGLDVGGLGRRPRSTSFPAPSPPSVAPPTSGSRSASPSAPGSAAARPTPRRCCAGRGATTSTLAASLGADVPFCLVGWPGPGDRASARSSSRCRSSAREFTLLTPPLVVSTAAVYRRWDELGGPTADGPNDLEPAALAVEPAAGRVARPARRCHRPDAAARRQRVDVVRRGRVPRRAGAVVTRTDRP